MSGMTREIQSLQQEWNSIQIKILTNMTSP